MAIEGKVLVLVSSGYGLPLKARDMPKASGADQIETYEPSREAAPVA